MRGAGGGDEQEAIRSARGLAVSTCPHAAAALAAASIGRFSMACLFANPSAVLATLRGTAQAGGAVKAVASGPVAEKVETPSPAPAGA